MSIPNNNYMDYAYTRHEQSKSRINYQIAPSILACDPLTIGREVEAIRANIQVLHIDIMDAQFVPNINGSIDLVKSLKKTFPDVLLDVHLMVAKPELLIDLFIAAGADLITMHYETLYHPHRYLTYLQSRGVLAGLAINPGTNVNLTKDLLNVTDVLLLMSVNPGFGGQSFIEQTYSKINEAQTIITQAKAQTLIESDGGVKVTNARKLWDMGVNVLVAGSAIFGQADPLRQIKSLEKQI